MIGSHEFKDVAMNMHEWAHKVNPPLSRCVRILVSSQCTPFEIDSKILSSVLLALLTSFFISIQLDLVGFSKICI